MNFCYAQFSFIMSGLLQILGEIGKRFCFILINLLSASILYWEPIIAPGGIQG